MNLWTWVPEDPKVILDVGCNVGVLLGELRRRFPDARVVGVEPNYGALKKARRGSREARLVCASADVLPFPDASIDLVTCTEVLEHIQVRLRESALREVWRVLRPGGRFILTVPHAGTFAWLDAQNVRFRLPRLYRAFLGGGNRDRNYVDMGREIVFHHHFRIDELESLLGAGWQRIGVEYGGFLVFPLADWLSWPFYRLGMESSAPRLLLERLACRDNERDYGTRSFGVLIALDKVSGNEI